MKVDQFKLLLKCNLRYPDTAFINISTQDKSQGEDSMSENWKISENTKSFREERRAGDKI